MKSSQSNKLGAVNIMATAQTQTAAAAPAAQSAPAPAPASSTTPAAQAKPNGFIQFFKNNWKKLVIGLIAVVLSIAAFIGGMALLDKAKKSAAAKASATPATQQIVSGDQSAVGTAPVPAINPQENERLQAVEQQLGELRTLLAQLLPQEGDVEQQVEEGTGETDEAEAPAAQAEVAEAPESSAPTSQPTVAQTDEEKLAEAFQILEKQEKNIVEGLRLKDAVRQVEFVQKLGPKFHPEYGSSAGDTLFIAVQAKDNEKVITPQKITFYMAGPKDTVAYPVAKYLIDGDRSNDPPGFIDALLRPKDFPPIILMPKEQPPFSLVGPLKDKYQWKLQKQLPVEIQNTADEINKTAQSKGWSISQYCYVLEKIGGGVIDPNDFADEYHVVVGHSSVALPPAKK